MKTKALLLVLIFLLVAGSAFAQIPSGTVTINLAPAVKKTSQEVKLWVPYPLSDEFQTISNIKVEGNYDTSGVYRDPSSEAIYFSAEWKKPSVKPTAVMKFHVTQKNRRNTSLKESKAPYPVLVQSYLDASPWVPSNDPEIRAIAQKATQGKSGTLAKAKGVYDWVVENTYRDPNVKGCGLGIPLTTLKQAGGGGKCADISAVFVTIARAAGIPARDVYGLRLASPKTGDITSAYHCWAEFYLPETGWVTVDPADVRKMMLIHNLKLKDAETYRSQFWGGDALFRVVLEKNARGVALNGAKEPLNYLMYPAAQVDGTMLNYFEPSAFNYSVTFKKDA